MIQKQLYVYYVLILQESVSQHLLFEYKMRYCYLKLQYCKFSKKLDVFMFHY